MKPRTAIGWALKSVKRRGLIQTFKVATSVLMDLGFDLRYGTDTMRWVEMDALEFQSEHKANAVRYTATKSGALKRLMRQLALPTDGVFVDFGAGKGRVLLIAAQCGFTRIVGVEFAPALCVIARRNVDLFLSKTRSKALITVVESDVAQFPIARDYTVFFLYNPFDRVVMESVLANLRASLHEFPRPVWVIYNTPLHDEVISQSGLFVPRRFKSGGTEFRIYRNQ